MDVHGLSQELCIFEIIASVWQRCTQMYTDPVAQMKKLRLVEIHSLTDPGHPASDCLYRAPPDFRITVFILTHLSIRPVFLGLLMEQKMDGKSGTRLYVSFFFFFFYEL